MITAAIGAGLGIAGGISKMIGGAKRKRAASQELKRLLRSRQEFRNINEGRRISTRGAEYAREGIQGTQATSVDALRSGGVRGVVGGMQGVQESANRYLQQEGSQLDQQQVQLDRDIARDEARIQQMNEQRQVRDEQNTQAALNAAQQDISSGMGDIAGSAFGAAALGAGGGGGMLAGLLGGGGGAAAGAAGAAGASVPQGAFGVASNAFGALTSAPQPQAAQSFSGQYVNNPYQFGITPVGQ